MSRFPTHTIESAPEAARESLTSLRRKFGAIPNLAAAMANSPGLLDGFLALREILYERSSFTPVEIQVLSLANALENDCRYCMALHSTLALKEGLSADSLAELRAGRPPREKKLAALWEFSSKLARRRGHVGETDLAPFLAAGYREDQALEVVLAAGASLLPNYAQHLAGAALDAPFLAQAWTRDAETASASTA